MSKKVINGSVFLDNMYLKQLPPGLLNDVYVFGDFDCHDNRLTSLEGAPTYVSGDFVCYYNNLTSLVGSPHSVSGDFNCRNNRLTSLEGAPRRVGGDFNCRSNPVKFTEEQVRAVCNVGRYVYV